MFLLAVHAGETILHQGAARGPDDCLYLLSEGEVDVVITGGGDHALNSREDRQACFFIVGFRVQGLGFDFDFRV